MKHKRIRIVAIIMLLIALSSVGCHANNAFAEQRISRYVIPNPTMIISGNQATCGITIRASGKEIDATLELWQGSTLIASWTDCKTGFLAISGTSTVTNGLTYTLTVSGTINGIPFTPVSVTKTA